MTTTSHTTTHEEDKISYSSEKIDVLIEANVCSGKSDLHLISYFVAQIKNEKVIIIKGRIHTKLKIQQISNSKVAIFKNGAWRCLSGCPLSGVRAGSDSQLCMKDYLMKSFLLTKDN